MKWVPSAPSTGKPRRRCGARRLAEAAERRRHQPRAVSGGRRPARRYLRRRQLGAAAWRDRRRSPRTCRRGSGTSDSRKPAAITKQSSATTSDRICCDAASPSDDGGAILPPSGTKCMPCHRGVVHAGHREAEGDRAQRSAACRPAARGMRAGRHRRWRSRPATDSSTMVGSHASMAKLPGEAMHADIVHADDAEPEQHRRRDHARQRRLADADKEQGNADHQRADQERDRWSAAPDRRCRPGSARPACRRNAWSRCRWRESTRRPPAAGDGSRPASPRMRAARPKPVYPPRIAIATESATR